MGGQGGGEGTSAVSLVPTGTILSNTAEMEIGVEPAYRETPGTSINQPSDLVSYCPQEYRACASMVTAHGEWIDCT